MFKKNKMIKADNLLTDLKEKNYIQNDNLKDFLLKKSSQTKTRASVAYLSTFGALIACLFFVFFLNASEFLSLNKSSDLFLLSTLFIFFSLRLRQTEAKNMELKTFFTHFSLTFSFLATILLCLGLGVSLKSFWAYPAAFFLLLCATSFFKSLPNEQFYLCFGLLLTLLTNIFWSKNLIASRELLLNLFFIVQILLSIQILINVRLYQKFKPFAYALIFSLCTGVLFLSMDLGLDYYRQESLPSFEFINFTLACTLFAFIFWSYRQSKALSRQPFYLSLFFTGLLSYFSQPGILLTCLVLIIGHIRQDKIIITTGLFTLPLFLIIYYNNLDTSLLEKSFILIFHGLGLISASLYIKYLGWDRGGLSCD